MRIHFVQGKYNAGGTRSTPILWEENYQLIASRRHPDARLATRRLDTRSLGLHARAAASSNRWREEFNVCVPGAGRARSSRSRRAAIDVAGRGFEKNNPAEAYSVGLTHGTCIKIVQLSMEVHAAQATTEARYELERFLHSPCLPFR